MSWAIGGPDQHGRWFGYGVPATCDQPDCGASIDRGLAHACGDGVMGDDNCGLFFCGDHLRHFREVADRGGVWVCDRCDANEPPFDPTPERVDWLTHLLTDDSWAEWRAVEPGRVADVRAAIAGATQ